MINETQLNNLLGTNINNIKSNSFYNSLINISNKFKTSSKLKSSISYIYKNCNIPNESFILSLFYLSKYVINCKKLNANFSISDNDYNINNYLLTSIIIANKQLLDNFPVRKFCNFINFDFYIFKNIEIDILNKLNWDTFISNNEFEKFKNYAEHYMD